MQVAQKAEARYVRAGVYIVFPAAFGGVFIQGGHGGDGGLHGLGAGLPHAARRAEDANTQPLGQHQLIPLLGRVVGINTVRMHRTHDGQAVFHITVGNGVATHQGAPGLSHLFRAAAHHLAQDIQVRLFRKAHNVQCCFYLAAHGPHVAEGVGGCDLPEGVGVIHHGREKVQGLHHRYIVCKLIHSGVVLAVKADEQVWVHREFRQAFQHTAQHPGPQLGGAAAALAKELALFHGIVSYRCSTVRIAQILGM